MACCRVGWTACHIVDAKGGVTCWEFDPLLCRNKAILIVKLASSIDGLIGRFRNLIGKWWE